MVTNGHFQPVLGAGRVDTGSQRKPQHSWKPSDIPAQVTPEEMWWGGGGGGHWWCALGPSSSGEGPGGLVGL